MSSIFKILTTICTVYSHISYVYAKFMDYRCSPFCLGIRVILFCKISQVPQDY